MRVAACGSSASLLSPDLYPQRETLVEADFNWRAREVLTERCEVCEPEPHCEVGCVAGPYSSYKEACGSAKAWTPTSRTGSQTKSWAMAENV
jgi:hypothetical protein